jgi:hypothetical protein
MARTKKVEPILETDVIQKTDITDQHTNNDNQPKNDNEPSNVDVVVTKSKRGRKPKNSLLKTSENTVENIVVSQNDVLDDKTENIILSNSEELNFETDETVKNTTTTTTSTTSTTTTTTTNNEASADAEIQIKPTGKKRGRKPKGGKIIQNVVPVTNIKENKPNIILHLKCSIKDLQNNVFENNINGYDLSSYKKDFLYEIISNNDTNTTHNYDCSVNNNSLKSQCQENINIDCCCDNDNYSSNKNNDLKDLWKKLKNLQHSLHMNNISDKKSACFWCTYEFDNPPIYIPKHYIKESYHVYGCFCSPECATSYLMEENIDSSTKFERYHLLNHIYSKIYNYTKNIKPAPKPYYILEKFYGNLNIQEYRSLLKNERLFLVVDKPLTRILPELHEDNDDFIINNKIIPSNTYQIKRKMLQKQNKSNILTEKFGLQQNS